MGLETPSCSSMDLPSKFVSVTQYFCFLVPTVHVLANFCYAKQTPLLVLLFFAPESPWWLIRKGRKDQALRSIERLSDKESAPKTLAMMERIVELEAHQGGNPTLLDLVKGTDLRRTIITCLMYASQNFAGNLIANQATFFFERKSSLLHHYILRDILNI